MDYRPIPDGHQETYQRMLRYAFIPERGPDFEEDPPDHPGEYRQRGLYDTPDDDAVLDVENLRAVCGYYDFTANVRGDWHSLGGITAVATPPESRRLGYARQMIDSLHEELRADDTAFAALWPFDYEFYRRLGYEMCNTYQQATVPAEKLDAGAAGPNGRFVDLVPDDFGRLDSVYRSWASQTLGLQRTEGWWRHRVFSAWHTERYVYGWENGDGSLRGYVVYTIEGEGGTDERTMQVHELAYADPEARDQLYRFCRDHDSQVSDVVVRGPPDVTLLETLTDPRAATVTRKPGPMVRVVDLEAAVESLSFAEGVTGSVTVAVAADHHDWNDGTFTLSFDDGDATCTETDADPDLSAGIGALSLVLVGARSASRLHQQGRLTVDPDCSAAAETLDAACPRARTYLREGF
jgi:predicted acetyltransferase